MSLIKARFWWTNARVLSRNARRSHNRLSLRLKSKINSKTKLKTSTGSWSGSGRLSVPRGNLQVVQAAFQVFDLVSKTSEAWGRGP